MIDLEALWNKILSEVKEDLDDHIYDSFLSDSYIYTIEKNKIYIATSSGLAANLLSTKYKTLFDTVTHDITQTDYELIFEKEEDLKKDKIIVKKEETPFFKESKLNPKYSFNNFIVGPSNKEAYQAALIVASNIGTMYNPLFLYSDSGLGKTHLLHSIGNYVKESNPRKNILIASTSQFIDEYIKGATGEKDLNKLKDFIKSFDVLLIDDIQALKGHDRTQQYFFDLFNYFKDNDKQIVLTSDKLPRELDGIEDRLVTRFSSGLSTKISSPSLSTSVEILKHKISQNGLNVDNFDEDALQYIAENKSSSVRDLEGALNKLLSYTINFKPTNHIDLQTTKEALQDIMNIKDAGGELTEKKIINIVCDYYNLTYSQVTGKSHIKQVADVRHIAMYLIRTTLNTPYKKIGELFGGKDHSTVMSAINKVENLCKTDKNMRKGINDLQSRLK